MAPPVTTTPKTTPKKETAAKKVTRARSVRQNASVKSKEFVNSTDSSSDDESTKPPTKKVTPNSTSTRANAANTATSRQSAAQNPPPLPTPARGAQPAQPKQRGAAKKTTKPPRGKKRSVSSSEEDSDSSASASDENINNKPVSDKNKNVTLRKLFWTNKGEGGGKGKGQVLIVDSSEDAQQQAQVKETPVPSEKRLSPYSGSKHSKHSTSIPSANNKHYNNNINTNNNNNTLMKCPTPLEQLPLTNSKPSGKTMVQQGPLLCKIDLSRLARIPANPRRKRSTNRDNTKFRLNNSRDSSTSSSCSDSMQRPTENGGSSRHRFEYDTTTVTGTNDRCKHSSSSSGYNSIESRLSHGDLPKIDEKLTGKSAIKHESLKNEFSNNEYNAYCNAISPPLKGLDEKQSYVSSKSYRGKGASVKRDIIKMETNHLDTHKLTVNDGLLTTNNRKKRASSSNSSPHKEKRRKKSDEHIVSQPAPPTNHDRLEDDRPTRSNVQKMYYSYFEHANDERDEIR